MTFPQVRSHLSTAWLWYLVISLHEIKYLQTYTPHHTSFQSAGAALTCYALLTILRLPAPSAPRRDSL